MHVKHLCYNRRLQAVQALKAHSTAVHYTYSYTHLAAESK
jgi:hypothetical protein